MIKNEALFSLMSGSGSTVYGLFETYEKAESAMLQFSGDYLSFISSYYFG